MLLSKFKVKDKNSTVNHHKGVFCRGIAFYKSKQLANEKARTREQSKFKHRLKGEGRGKLNRKILLQISKLPLAYLLRIA